MVLRTLQHGIVVTDEPCQTVCLWWGALEIFFEA